MNVGDGRTIGDYVNRPLTKRRAYKIFVRAFTADNVSRSLYSDLFSSVQLSLVHHHHHHIRLIKKFDKLQTRVDAYEEKLQLVK